MYNTVAVTFNDNAYGQPKQYHYLTKEQVKIGQTALVHNGTELRLVTIQEIIPGASKKATKPLVKLLPEDLMNAYEAQLIEIKEVKDKLLQLDILLKQYEEAGKYAFLAQSSPEAAKLLQDLGLVPKSA
jgi:hypothetical protein